MIRKKGVEIAAVVLIVLALAALCGCYLWMENSGTCAVGETKEYESTLFGTDSVLSIDIRMEEDAFQEMLENAAQEEYAACDVEINGTTYYNVGIRPKGNSSLTQVISSGSDRFSFKMEFDHYVDGQTLCGLDKLVLNNGIGDATYMKEYISYAMFQYMGVPSSLCNFARVSVNGEYFGLYLALEGMEEAFIERNYGSLGGALYKPEGEEMGGGKQEGGKEFQGGDRPEKGGFPGKMGVSGAALEVPGGQERTAKAGGFPGGMEVSGAALEAPGGQETTAKAGGFPGEMEVSEVAGGLPEGQEAGNFPGRMEVSQAAMDFPGEGKMGRMGSRASSGAGLVYTGDNVEDYSDIFENSVLNSSDAQEQRIVEALEKLSKGEDLEEYFNVDEILRYFAVNAVTVNLDSYFGNMLHNYYLYLDCDNRISILPWDFNLAFGGFQSGSTSSYVNFPIDTLVSGAERSERPLIDKLLSVEEYRDRYHAYLKQMTEYIENGSLELAVTKANQLIADDVKEDPTAFFTYEEYQKAYPVLLTVCQLRAQSIRGQLEGTIPSTQEEQQEDSGNLIDCTGIQLRDMGEQNGKGLNGKEIAIQEIGDTKDAEEGGETAEPTGPEGDAGEGMQKPGETEEGTEATGGMQKPGEAVEGTEDAGGMQKLGEAEEGTETTGEMQKPEATGETLQDAPERPNMGEAGEWPDKNMFPGEREAGSEDTWISYAVLAGCLVAMTAAIIFAKAYRRKKLKP